MAVSGLPEPCTTHARDIAKLALDMMERCKGVMMDGEPVVKISCNDFENVPSILILIFVENYYWDTFRRSCDWCYRA